MSSADVSCFLYFLMNRTGNKGQPWWNPTAFGCKTPWAALRAQHTQETWPPSAYNKLQHVIRPIMDDEDSWNNNRNLFSWDSLWNTRRRRWKRTFKCNWISTPPICVSSFFCTRCGRLAWSYLIVSKSLLNRIRLILNAINIPYSVQTPKVPATRKSGSAKVWGEKQIVSFRAALLLLPFEQNVMFLPLFTLWLEVYLKWMKLRRGRKMFSGSAAVSL